MNSVTALMTSHNIAYQLPDDDVELKEGMMLLAIRSHTNSCMMME
jgi:hypothetical protein